MRIALALCGLLLAFGGQAQVYSPNRVEPPQVSPPQPPQPEQPGEPLPEPITQQRRPGSQTNPRRSSEEPGFYSGPLRRYTKILRDFVAQPLAEPPLLALPPLSHPDTAVAPAPVVAPPPAVLFPGPEPDPDWLRVALGSTQAGGVAMPALSLHPEGITQATLVLTNVAIPKHTGLDQRFFLLFSTALADPLVEPDPAGETPPAEGAEAPLSEPNAATVTPPLPETAAPAPLKLVMLAGERTLYTGTLSGRAWEMHAIELTNLWNQVLDLTVRASTLDPNEMRAVAAIGQPLLIEMQGPYYAPRGGRGLPFSFKLAGFPRQTPGLAMVRVRTPSPSTVRIQIGSVMHEYTIEQGSHWLPLVFNEAGPFSFDPMGGDTKLHRLEIAPFTPPTPPVTPEDTTAATAVQE